MNYKKSIYNFWFEDEAGHKIVWNSFKNTLQFVEECDFTKLHSDNLHGIAEDNLNLFLKTGILLRTDIDEAREVIWRNNRFADDGLSHYRILTTTGCNAACEYCYEKGVAVQHMTKDTALKTAEFICRNRLNQICNLEWFGGEPLVNVEPIDIICMQLRKQGMPYKSVMETNGSLFNRDLISRAVDLWNLKRVQITIDGIDRKHEAAKKFKPGIFDIIVRNMHILLDTGIKVAIRIIHTGDTDNEAELIYYLNKEFPIDGNRPAVYLSPLYKAGKTYEAEYVMQIIELNRILIETKFAEAGTIYDMRKYSGRCFASTINGYTIAPDGTTYNCSHNMSENQRTGTIWLNEEPNQVRKDFVFRQTPQECVECIMFPVCRRGCRVAETKLAPMTQCHIFKNVIKEALLERVKYEK